MPPHLRIQLNYTKTIKSISNYISKKNGNYIIILLTVISLFTSIGMIVVTEKSQNFEDEVFNELGERSILINSYTTLMMGGFYPIAKVEQCRILKEVLVIPPLMFKYGNPPTVAWFFQAPFARLLNKFWTNIIHSLGNSNFQQLMDKDKIFGLKEKIKIIKNPPLDWNNKSDMMSDESHVQNMSLTQAITFNTGFASYFLRRIYIDRTLPFILRIPTRPRYLDVLEEQYR